MALPVIVAVATKLGIEVAKYFIKKNGKKVLKEGAEKQLKKQVSKQTSQAKRDIRRESSDRLEVGFRSSDKLQKTKPKVALRHKRRSESNSRQNQSSDSKILITAQGKKKTAKFLKENRDRGFKPKKKVKSGLGIKDK